MASSPTMPRGETNHSRLRHARCPRCSSRATLVGQTGCFADETPLLSKAAKRGLRARNHRWQEIPPFELPRGAHVDGGGKVDATETARLQFPWAASPRRQRFDLPTAGAGAGRRRDGEIQKKSRRCDDSAIGGISGVRDRKRKTARRIPGFGRVANAGEKKLKSQSSSPPRGQSGVARQ